MPTRKEQKEKRYWEILNAALDLFIRKGYAATKVSDIAQAVGMSTGLLFHYFESKEKLYTTLIEFGIQGPQQVMELDQSDPLAFFEEAARQVLLYVTIDSFTAKMFALMSQAQYSDAIPDAAKSLVRGFNIFEPTAALIRKGQQQGTIRAGDPLALALTFWMSIMGIAEALVVYPDFPCPQSDWIVDVLRRREA
ncbi:MAG: TetR/AcrR family transcriptional regulator [Coriobacteriia bacterium]|nr:TetR/AcrR family transcriptional regulator [Coriobacteriia bacterium]